MGLGVLSVSASVGGSNEDRMTKYLDVVDGHMVANVTLGGISRGRKGIGRKIGRAHV